MILEEETFEKFGYYPHDLKQQSHKRILVRCDKCGKVRENYMDKYRTLCISCAQTGKTPSKATRIKLSIAGKGKKHSEEHHRKIAIANTGKKRSEEVCKNISIAKKGENCSEETRKKLSVIASNRSEETCKKLSIAATNRSEETRKKLSIANTGKTQSKEAREKMSIAQTGERNGNWNGGSSFKPYCPKFNEQYKEKIRDKFGRKCFLCDKTEKENKQKLSVHHIGYNKNCGCDEIQKIEDCRCVPLCRRCHNMTGSNRDWWNAVLSTRLDAYEYVKNKKRTGK